MSWNYRIVKYSDETGFGLHEVHYGNDGKPISMTEWPTGFVGDTAEEVQGALMMARTDAIKRPILDEPNWPRRRTEDGQRAVVYEVGVGKPAANDLLAACKVAEKLLDALLGFYGQGLEVANWHRNGDTEPLDTFFDDNSDGTELAQIRAAIAKAT